MQELRTSLSSDVHFEEVLRTATSAICSTVRCECVPEAPRRKVGNLFHCVLLNAYRSTKNQLYDLVGGSTICAMGAPNTSVDVKIILAVVDSTIIWVRQNCLLTERTRKPASAAASTREHLVASIGQYFPKRIPIECVILSSVPVHDTLLTSVNVVTVHHHRATVARLEVDRDKTAKSVTNMVGT